MTTSWEQFLSPSAMAGFDQWGFRNREVPETADIVAVGDSHTYGNTARMVDSWPFVLGTLTGQPGVQHGFGRVWAESILLSLEDQGTHA